MTVSPFFKYLFRYVALAYLLVLLIVPVGLILWRTFAPGLGAFFTSISTPAAVSALQLSLLIVAIVVPLNVLFGVPTALVLARNKFRGKSVLQAVIDLPFAVSPVVVGVALGAVHLTFHQEAAARARKDFKESDRIRDELAAMGVVIKDSKEGTTWEIAR